MENEKIVGREEEKEKCSFLISVDLMTALRVFSTVSNKGMSEVVEASLDAFIPDEVKKTAEGMTARFWTHSDLQEKKSKKPVRKPAASLESVSGKPEGFDEKFWAFLEERNIASTVVAARLKDAGHEFTPEGIRYWQKAKKGIPANMVEPLMAVFPELLPEDERY